MKRAASLASHGSIEQPLCSAKPAATVVAEFLIVLLLVRFAYETTHSYDHGDIPAAWLEYPSPISWDRPVKCRCDLTVREIVSQMKLNGLSIDPTTELSSKILHANISGFFKNLYLLVIFGGYFFAESLWTTGAYLKDTVTDTMQVVIKATKDLRLLCTTSFSPQRKWRHSVMGSFV